MPAVAVIIAECVAIHTASGKTAAAESEPTDTRRAIDSMAMKTTTAARTAPGETAAKHPAAVATPLPPSRKFRYTGKRWPQNAASATAAG